MLRSSHLEALYLQVSSPDLSVPTCPPSSSSPWPTCQDSSIQDELVERGWCGSSGWRGLGAPHLTVCNDPILLIGGSHLTITLPCGSVGSTDSSSHQGAKATCHPGFNQGHRSPKISTWTVCGSLLQVKRPCSRTLRSILWSSYWIFMWIFHSIFLITNVGLYGPHCRAVGFADHLPLLCHRQRGDLYMSLYKRIGERYQLWNILPPGSKEAYGVLWFLSSWWGL